MRMNAIKIGEKIMTAEEIDRLIAELIVLE